MTGHGAGPPPEAHAVALSELAGCGHRRLAVLLAAGPPTAVWSAVRDGRLMSLPGVVEGLGPAGPGLAGRWREEAAAVDPARRWEAVRRLGAGVWFLGGPGYPEVLAGDPAPPPVLYRQGRAGLAGRAAVAVVGTRRCTGYGADVARQLGRELAGAGVVVISGLALGIDGAAHQGALAVAGQPPLAVVGSGLDVVYPARHRRLWARVAQCGLVVSEAPLGTAPEPWRFPLRNRMIAGLSSVVVVVESHQTGGSMSTVRAAIDRGVPVMAVPGSVRSPASAGTNALLAEGAAPALGAADVLVALALEGAAPAPVRPPPGPPPGPHPRLAPDPDHEAVLAAVDWGPTATEDVLRRSRLDLGAASVALTRLEMAGLVRRRGGWWERCGPAAAPVPAPG